MSSIRRAACAVGGVALLAASGCGGAAVPQDAQSEAMAAVRSARAVGAEQQPQAAYHLELAAHQLEEANERIEEGRMEQAERLLRQAEADAELAVALTRQARTQDEARQTMQRIQQMRERHL